MQNLYYESIKMIMLIKKITNDYTYKIEYKVQFN